LSCRRVPSFEDLPHLLLPLALVGDVLLHTLQVVVDCAGWCRCRLGSVHTLSKLILQSDASGGTVACRGPACCQFVSFPLSDLRDLAWVSREEGAGDVQSTVDMTAMQGFSNFCFGAWTRRISSGGRRMGLGPPAGMLGDVRGALG
jgi:hypothetical protein